MRVRQDLRLRRGVADPSGSAQGALDILVAGRFLEKNLNGNFMAQSVEAKS
jgi:hypothetical protein